tara:strand:+ start:20 stop:328 length:309 start_codon:yes stop_codon:yes gene_type:complete
MAKEISNAAYQWGHFGVILFEIIVSSIIIYLAYRIKNSPEVLKNVNTFGNGDKIFKRKISSLRRIKLFANIIIWISVLVIIISLLGLIPVFKNYEGGIVINQ